jgi:hypothetical protein
VNNLDHPSPPTQISTPTPKPNTKPKTKTNTKGDADATWIFAPWEGALAARAGVELHRFDPAAYVDYGYSPVVVARHDWLRCGVWGGS